MTTSKNAFGNKLDKIATLFTRNGKPLEPDQYQSLALFLRQLSRQNGNNTMMSWWGARWKWNAGGQLQYTSQSTRKTNTLKGPVIQRNVQGNPTVTNGYRMQNKTNQRLLTPNQLSLLEMYLKLHNNNQKQRGVVALANSRHKAWGAHVHMKNDRIIYKGFKTRQEIIPVEAKAKANTSAGPSSSKKAKANAGPSSPKKAKANAGPSSPKKAKANTNAGHKHLRNNVMKEYWIKRQVPSLSEPTFAAETILPTALLQYELVGRDPAYLGQHSLIIKEPGSINKCGVITTKCGLKFPKKINIAASSLADFNITPIRGEIMKAIHDPGTTSTQGLTLGWSKTKKRHCVFVLPSQLNGAEYSTMDNTVVRNYTLADYLHDNTGGPRGQLACDLAVAQFVLDNACNVNNPEAGINNVRDMGFVKNGMSKFGCKFTNGYLLPGVGAQLTDQHIQDFGDALDQMTVLGTTGVRTNGLNPYKKKRMNSKSTVDLVYASAAPVDGQYNPYGNRQMKVEIGNRVLFGQYVCALRVAIARGECDVVLMPLGGGVFGNDFHDIKNMMVLAVQNLSNDLQKAGVRVFVLAWEGSPTEWEFWSA